MPDAILPLSTITVVRREDLLFLTFQFINLGLKLLPAGDALLERLNTGAAFIMVHFPQQSIAEQAVFQTQDPPLNPPMPPSTPDFNPPLPGASEKFPSTAQARVSGLSRLAFTMPPTAKSMPFTFAELMAWEKWLPSLAGPASTYEPPSEFETAIEAPYRLIISPADNNLVWRHRTGSGKLNDRVELWHTRLSVPPQQESGTKFFVLSNLEARAIWARDFDLDNTKKFTNPFRTSLSPRQRTELVQLTSTTKNKFTTPPATVEQLMLTPLGAYLHLHGEWDLAKLNPKLKLTTPLKVSEWRHRATLGRDHYVRVVEEGTLFPFGHRAALVTITQRQFQTQSAYLTQQMFIIIREQVRTLDISDKVKTTENASDTQTTDRPLARLLMPFRSLRLTTPATPLIDPPTTVIAGDAADAFWIKVNSKEFMFTFVGEDWAGQPCEFIAPALFVSNNVGPANTPSAATKIGPVIKEYNKASRRVAIAGRQIAFAAPSPTSKQSDTSYETQSLIFKAVATVASSGAPPLPFHPAMQLAEVRIAAVEHMTGAAGASTIQYYVDYTKKGLQGGEVFAQVTGTGPTLNFTKQAQRSGGLFTPNFNANGLSRKGGVVGGSLDAFNSDKFSPASFFHDNLDPKLLGCVSLRTLIAEVSGNGAASAPRLVSAPIYAGGADAPVAFETTFDWTPQVAKDGNKLLKFDDPMGKPSLLLQVKIHTSLQGGAPTFDIKGELNKFHIELVGAIKISFESLVFKQPAGQKMDVAATLSKPPVSFLGPLRFLNTLTEFIDAVGFDDPPSLDVDASGARLGYTLALPDLTVGSFALQNAKLSAALNIPFSSAPVRFRFAFGERHDPFLVTVSAVAGGGFVGIGIGADGIEMIEASLEFGGNIAINLGVATGGVSIMGGFYIGSTKTDLTFSAYIRACGALEVLGLICVTIEFYLALEYSKPENGTARLAGVAIVTVEVEVVFFSKSVSVKMERTLLGSAGDPTFTQMMNRNQWTAYRNAFAA